MSRLRTACLVLTAALLVSCAARQTTQAPSVRPSGFLGDYSKLRPGAEGEARLLYRAPGLDLSPYTRMILDRVQVWDDARARGGVPSSETQGLADLFYATILARVRTYYVMTQNPEPGTVRLRVALTEAAASSPTLDIMSNIGPITGLISGVTKLATGTHAFVGAASAEAELLDAQDGRVLLAAVDRRVGEKTLTGATGSWSDVENALIVWSDRLIDRLQAAGGPRRPLPYWAQPR